MSDEASVTGGADASQNRLVLPPAVFSKIYKLGLACPWTQSKIAALTHLLCTELSDFDQIELVCEILERFRVINSTEMATLAETTAKHLVSEWGFVPGAHRIVAVSDEAEADGSQQFLLAIRTALMAQGGWGEVNFISNIGSAAKLAKKNQVFFLLDDFIGTGTKIVRKVEWFKKKVADLDKVTITFGAIGAMERAKDALDSTGCKYYAPVWLKRAISDHGTPETVNEKTAIMKEIEKILQSKLDGRFLSQFSLGYKKSESAFWIEPMNIPNNVFPIFWWRKDRLKRWRKTVFVAS